MTNDNTEFVTSVLKKLAKLIWKMLRGNGETASHATSFTPSPAEV